MKEISIDDIDLQLLALLQHDATLSNQALAEQVHVSPPTCLRRIKRLHASGLIERQIAVLNPEKMAAHIGHGLQVLVEVSLERQDAEALAAFEARAVTDAAVSICWQVSPRARLRAGRAGARHAQLPRPGAKAVHQRRQCAQRESFFQRATQQVFSGVGVAHALCRLGLSLSVFLSSAAASWQC